MNYKLLYIYLHICLFAYLLIPANAYAEVDLGIYPPIIQIDAIAPAAITTPFTIQNFGNDPLALDIQIKPFQSSSQYNGSAQMLSENTFPGEDPQIAQKIKVLDPSAPLRQGSEGQAGSGSSTTSTSIDQIILAPQEEKQLNLEIDLPKGEPPSDYYFSIIFLSKPEDLVGKTQSGVSGGIATNVLLSIGPKDPTTGFLRDFSSPWYVNRGPVPFHVLVENTSRHFIVPKGQIIIKNMFGQIVGKVELLGVNILAKSKRYIPDSSSKRPTTNDQQATAVWNEKILLGPYRAELTFALSNDGPLFQKTIHFFAFPAEYILGLILTCLLVASVIWRVRARLRKS